VFILLMLFIMLEYLIFDTSQLIYLSFLLIYYFSVYLFDIVSQLKRPKWRPQTVNKCVALKLCNTLLIQINVVVGLLFVLFIDFAVYLHALSITQFSTRSLPL